MADAPAQRRLAAVLAADVAGYSRLVSLDEDATLRAFQSHLTDFIEPTLVEHGGRLFKTMGDGLLAEFASVVAAVQCAVAVQEGMRLRNDGVPRDRRIEFRIGINLGDIVVQDEDLLGDGVNVASRLEGLAEPGGICISRSARDQVRDKLNFRLEDCGEVEVKNIPRPVRVFRVHPDERSAGAIPVRAAGGKRRKWTWVATVSAALVLAGAAVMFWAQQQAGTELPDGKRATEVVSDKPSIAVLPFANMSDDTAQEYFSDGLAEDLTTDLSKIAALTVIAPDSAASFRGDDADIGKVGAVLGVRYVVKGSVRKIGGDVRINTKLIDTRSGAHVWAERYDRKFSDVFALQDEILDSIVTALAVRLAAPGSGRGAKRGTNNAEAYDLFLQARHLESQSTSAGIEEALHLYERALDLDPKFAVVYARMANLLEQKVRGGWAEDHQQELDKAQRLARRALALDGDNPFAHWTLGRVTKGDSIEIVERAIKSIERAIELQPNYADAHAYLTYLYNGVGRIADADRSIQAAMRLNPLYPYWYLHARGEVRYMRDDFEGAVSDFEAAAQRNPAVHFVQFWLAAAYAMAGRTEDAQWQVEEMQGLGIKSTIKRIMETTHIQSEALRQKFLDGLKKAGVPD